MDFDEFKINDNNWFVYLDINFGNIKVGRVTIELYKDLAPKTVANFYELCIGNKKNYRNKYVGYKGSTFHRVVPQCLVQSGHIIKKSNEIEIIENESFVPEKSILKHSDCGIVGMSNNENGTVSSQFYITTVPCFQLDGLNIAFGKVRAGLDLIKEMAAISRDENDKPLEDIWISDCGSLPVTQIWNLSEQDETNDELPPYPVDWIDRESLNYNEIEILLQNVKEAGNTFYQQGKLGLAKRKYDKTLRYLKWYETSRSDYNKKLVKKCRIAALLNLAAVGIEENNWKDVKDLCDQVIQIDSNNGKAFYRRAQACLGLLNIDEALLDFQTAYFILPNNKKVKKALDMAKNEKIAYLRKEKLFYSKIFNS